MRSPPHPTFAAFNWNPGALPIVVRSRVSGQAAGRPASPAPGLLWASGLVLAIALVAALPGPARAAGADAAAEQRHASESAACASKADAEDRKTCLKEAGAAKAEAAKNRLAKPGADLAANAKMRCDALPGDQKTACLARMDGAGVRSGSVEGGGIYRELTVRTPAASAAATGAVTKP